MQLGNKKRAVGYIRVSTKVQIEGTSIGVQKRRIKDYCKSQNYEFIESYTDKGVSGSVKERPEFQRMLVDAKAHAFDVVVVLAIDRLARNLHHFLDTFEQLKEWEIGLVSVSQQINTESVYGDFTIKLLSLLADLERETIRERTKSGRVASFRDGKAFPGRPPYGYLWDNKNKKIKIDEGRAKYYRKIVDMYLIDHISTTSIAERLTQMDIETPGSRLYKNKKSTRWSDDMVRRMLHNPAYAGEATYLKNGYVTAVSEDGHPYHKKVDKPNDSDPITIKFPALISSEGWGDIQKQIEYNKRKPKKIRKKDAIDKFLTSNTLGKHFICNLCGSVIRARIYNDKRAHKTRYQYGCSRHLMSNKQLKLRGKEHCPLPAINSDGFDFEVWSALITIISSPMRFLKDWISPEKHKSFSREIKQFEKKQVKKEKELDRITDLIAIESDALIVESYQRKQRELSAQIDQIRADIAVKRRENKVSAESIKYLKKIVEEAEEAVTQIEEIVTDKQHGDVEGVVIPTIFFELEKLESYDAKKEVLEAIVSPEKGGYVKMAYDYDEKLHYPVLDSKLNYLRTAHIIEGLKNGTVADGTFFNPNYLRPRP